MAAGDPGTRKRNYSAIAVETKTLSSLAAASSGDVNTGLILNSVSGFPSTVPYTLIIDPDTSKEEVVTVTAASSTTITVVRGQDNTTAVAHAAGVSVRHGVSAREFKELQTHISARGYDTDSSILSGVDSHVHGIATGEGDVVGTAKTQTLTNKTISGGAFTGSITATGAELQNVTLAGVPVITGLSSVGMVSSSATPKSYVDAILGSSTSAATSAASALVSANSAATSASSAATSASSADATYTSIIGTTGAGLVRDMGLITDTDTTSTTYINIATVSGQAQTSATSAATSATSAETSATSAANSAAAAATSASSAATSASSAATSASSAAASAAAAAGYLPAVTAGVSGYFLTNNGTTASWASLSDWGTV